jgi:hypothetical protein
MEKWKIGKLEKWKKVGYSLFKEKLLRVAYIGVCSIVSISITSSPSIKVGYKYRAKGRSIKVVY